ncbi:MAG TPA: CHAP domain-containing protein [Stellaceae bacterium]|nr:CHAP domain-containing protein [Stellaceae bacterium]
MRAKLGWGLVWGAILVGCFAGHSRKAAAGNCALYARAVTGVNLYGAAGYWWYEAAGRYQRGQVPAVGSILVFRPTGVIPSGHVAVVSKVIGPDMVLVDQSNWYHGRVTLGTPVADTSPNHDWTTVTVMNVASGQFGRDNPTFGFVYPQSASTQTVAGLDTGGFDPQISAARASYEPGQQPELFHFAAADSDGYRRVRGHRFAHRRTARYAIRHDHAGRRSRSSTSHAVAQHIRHHQSYRTASAD